MSATLTPIDADTFLAAAARRFGVLYGAFAVALGYGMLVPLVPAYLQAGAGSRDVALHSGALAATFMLAASLAAPLWGHLSDRAGRTAVILAGLAGAAAAPLPFMLAQGLPELYAFQALAGIFFAAVVPTATALQFEEGDPEGRGRRLAMLGAATLAGYLAGPVLGGWLGGLAEASPDALPARDVTLAALASHASLVGLGVPVVWVGRRAGPRQSPGAEPHELHGMHASFGAAALVLAAATLAAFALGGFEISTSLHVRNALALGSRAVAAVFIACGLGMLIAQVVFLPALSRRPLRLAWPLGLLGAVAALLASIPLAQSQGTTLAAAATIGAALGLAIALLGLHTATFAGRRRGLALGLQNAALNAGQSAGSLSGGALFGWLGGGSFVALAALVAAGAVLLACPRKSN